MSVSFVKAPPVGTFLARIETGVAYQVTHSGGFSGHAHATLQAPTGDGPFIAATSEPSGWHSLATFRPATTDEIDRWHAVRAITSGVHEWQTATRDLHADETDNECEGHESLAGDKMGESAYCDGTCN